MSVPEPTPNDIMNRIRSLVAAGAALATAGCGSNLEPITDLPRDLRVAERALIAADNSFSFKLFHEIDAQADPSENLFVSPLSVAMALGMTQNGAAGTTLDAMRATLELAGMDDLEVNEAYRSLIDLLRDLDPSVEFLLANSIWYRETFAVERAFLDINTTYFDAEIAALDFSSPNAVPTINAWVDEQTGGKIPEIVDAPIPNDVIMYLINAIYFKGDWTHQFDRDDTRPAPFQLADGTTVVVDMMSRDETPMLYHSGAEVQIADLPYGGGAYRMTIVLPGSPAGIDDLAANLTQSRWDAWVAELDSSDLQLALPRFGLEYEIALEDALSALGMEEAFCDSRHADFSRLYGPARPGQVCITRVKHKTFIEVNEEGTEAAAATAVEVGVVSVPPSVRVDRPFLFVIRERLSGTILFIGKVMDPTS